MSWQGKLISVIAPGIKVLANTIKFRLEERRKVKGAAYYERKKAAKRQLVLAQRDAKIDEKTKAQLADYGY